MSYSRWSDSNWYTFWNTSSPDATKDEQVLSLWYAGEDLTDFTYKELKSFDISKMQEKFPNADTEDLEEALGYIQMFFDRVDRTFAEDDKKSC